jgi:hypothetical protein
LPAASQSEWIFPQEKSSLTKARAGTLLWIHPNIVAGCLSFEHLPSYILDSFGNDFGFLHHHEMAGALDDAELRIFGAVREVDLKAVPRVVDAVALGDAEIRKGFARRSLAAFEYDHRNVIVPG